MVFGGKQSRFVEPSDTEKARQKKNYKSRMETVEARHWKNFWVLDTETTGFPEHGGRNEPIQITAQLYRDGK